MTFKLRSLKWNKSESVVDKTSRTFYKSWKDPFLFYFINSDGDAASNNLCVSPVQELRAHDSGSERGVEARLPAGPLAVRRGGADHGGRDHEPLRLLVQRWRRWDVCLFINVCSVLVFMLTFVSAERELVTPPLDGIILPGVTRQSLLDLSRTWVSSRSRFLSPCLWNLQKSFLSRFDVLPVRVSLKWRSGRWAWRSCCTRWTLEEFWRCSERGRPASSVPSAASSIKERYEFVWFSAVLVPTFCLLLFPSSCCWTQRLKW